MYSEEGIRRRLKGKKRWRDKRGEKRVRGKVVGRVEADKGEERE